MNPQFIFPFSNQSIYHSIHSNQTYNSLLPKPKNLVESRQEQPSRTPQQQQQQQQTQNALILNKQNGPPPYRKRKNFVPKTPADFGDGGAFPEIHTPQYPNDMGNKKKKQQQQSLSSTSSSLPLTTDASTGKIQYDMILRQGPNDTRIIHSSLSDMTGIDVAESDEWARPDQETIEATTNRTREALEKLVQNKIKASQPKQVSASASSNGKSEYIRYTPNPTGVNANGQSRVIKMVEAPVDPLLPPQFKHKRIPRGPPSPPAPVMHSPPRKVTQEDQQAWVIPPCISNWKNAKGYTISLDKRLAADGRGLQETTINDNFAKLSEALFIADRHARDEVRLRADMQARLAAKEKDEKEQKLRMLAQKAREERMGVVSNTGGEGVVNGGEQVGREESVVEGRGRRRRSRTASSSPSSSSESSRSRSRSRTRTQTRRRPRSRSSSSGSSSDSETNMTAAEREAYKDRQRLRRERARERERALRLTHMGNETKAKVLSKLSADRDVSEKIALGLAQPTVSKETMYDTRLFNQSEGMSSGFGGGNDDSYNVYDKALFAGGSSASIYRPKRVEQDSFGGVDIEGVERMIGGHGEFVLLLVSSLSKQLTLILI